MAKLALWTTFAPLAYAQVSDDLASNLEIQNDQNDITERLNGMIAKGGSGVYSGGKGVMVRTPDFFTGNTAIVPATLWVNDILAPSQLYPSGNPMCPTNGDGWSGLQTDCSSGSPWNNAIVAVVVGSSMNHLMTDWDSVQSADWGWGVFYAFDSNSADSRCIWIDDYYGWDCPGAWVDGDGNLAYDKKKKGSGNYAPGNPYASGGGGGSGCHWNGDGMDQMDALEMNLVQDRHCQCEMGFSDNWEHWVQQWIYKGIQKPGFEWRGWFGNGKAPTWGVDSSICWVSNIRDMIKLQNALYYYADSWSNQMIPQSDWSKQISAEERIYWGWNEIPVKTSAIDDPSIWDSVIIKLPADVCGNGGSDDNFGCLSKSAKDDLYNQLKAFESAGNLLTGSSHITSRPGSYILFVREMRVDGGWSRHFFCKSMNWRDRQILTTYKACWYDQYSSSIDVV